MITQTKVLDIQGHRGARGLYPENTLTAFMEALRLGVNTLEMDVVISSDNRLVVSHEPWMSEEISTRPDGQPVEKNSKERYNIYKMTYDEVKQFDVGKRGHPRFPQQKAVPERKPMLAEVIAAAEQYCKENNLPSVQYNIETKSLPETDLVFHPEPKTFVHLLYEELKAHGVLERVIIQSFDVRTLQELHRLDSTVKTALLVENVLGPARNIKKLGFTPSIYSPDYHLLNKKAVERLHEQNILVIPWTINEVEDMRKMVEMGVDGIITDYPDIALKAGLQK